MNLTAREEQIMSLLATGMQDRAIAYCTGISVRTVHAHLTRIYAKNQVINRYGAIIKYFTHLQQLKRPVNRGKTVFKQRYSTKNHE